MPQPQYQSPTISPNAPTITGRDITIDFLLNNPTVIASRVASLANQRLISNYIFRSVGGVQGGALIYNRVDSNQVYLTRDVQTIAEAAEFPLVDASEPAPLIVTMSKFGGSFEITDEARRRNSQDIVSQMETKFTNNMIRRQDTAALRTFANDPIISAAVTGVGDQSTGGTKAAVAAWSDRTNGDPITDISNAVAIINNRELGYEADTVLLNPADLVKLLQRPDIRTALPRETAPGNPIINGQMGGFLGLNWVPSNRVDQGSCYVLQRGVIGGIAEEVPLTMETERRMSRQVTVVYGSRTTGTFIDNPLAVIKITGI